MTTDQKQILEEKLKSSTILFVDDESNILSSLRRLFRPSGYRVLVAESGPAGLEIIEHEEVDLVVSDMRMPEMDGAQFLERVAARWPEIVRILLTGYADLASTVDAINKGHIYRYISKPWEDNDFKLTVQQALEQRFLRRERDRLLALTRRQNRELKELNASLEAKVQARTEEIKQTADMLELAYQEMKRSYLDAIPVFANLLEMRSGDTLGHSRRVAEGARELAKLAGLDEEAVQNVYVAGLLHDLGKIGLPDAVFEKDYVSLSPAEKHIVARHPVLGQQALMDLEPLQPATLLIRHHHEHFDGSGYPDALAGDAIPVGARILTIVNDYDALQLGTLLEGQFPPEEARLFLEKHAGTRYDPELLELFLQWLETQPAQGLVIRALRLVSSDLRPGMVLAKDLINEQGLLLLAKGRVLDDRLIERIRNFESEESRGFTIFVKNEAEGDASHNAGG